MPKIVRLSFRVVFELVHYCVSENKLLIRFNYRPQRSWAKVMFLQASIILLTGGVSASVHAGIPPPGNHTPPGADTPPGPDTPGIRHPPGTRHPRDQTPPRADTHPPGADPPGPDTHPQSTHPPQSTPPPPGKDSGIRSTTGRYASYWNVFLFIM